MKQAVIFLGGRGSRLKPLTNSLPKPMVLVNNKPFLDYLIFFLINKGFNNFIFLCGYKNYKIIQRYKKSKLNINFIIGKATDNPEKRLVDAKKFLKKNFLLLYGDNFLYLKNEFKDFQKFAKKKLPNLTLLSFSNKNGTGEYGSLNNIDYDNNYLVIKYKKSINYKSIDIGFFYLSRRYISANKKTFSFKNLIKTLIRDKKMYTYVTNTQYYYITTIKSLRDFERYVIRKKIKPLPESYFF